MDRAGARPSGCIYRVSPDLQVSEMFRPVAIPNTFLFHEDSVIWADSAQATWYRAKTGRVPLQPETLYTVEQGEPDGSCWLRQGMWLNARWDAACLGVESISSGTLELSVAGLRPTSCTICGQSGDRIFVTSASVDMSDEDLGTWPWSGRVLMADLAPLHRHLSIREQQMRPEEYAS